MKIENLTDGERMALVVFDDGVHHLVGAKAVRIIDAQAARIAELKAQLPDGMKHCTIRFIECPVGHGRLTAANWEDSGCLVCERDAANALAQSRANRAETNMLALQDVSRELAAANARADAAEQRTRTELARVDRAESESEAAALRADNLQLGEAITMWQGLAHEECQRRSMVEVSRDELRAEVERLNERYHRGCVHNDFMRGMVCEDCGTPRVMTAVERGKAVERMFEPEPPRAAECTSPGGEGDCYDIDCPSPVCNPSPRAAAERAVLDAMAAVCENTLHMWAVHPSPHVRAIARAELARRAVKP